MFEPYFYKTFESLPAKTVITVTSCARCPFHHVLDETDHACTHPERPEYYGDEPRIYGNEDGVPIGREDLSTVPDWCPMRDLAATTVMLADKPGPGKSRQEDMLELIRVWAGEHDYAVEVLQPTQIRVSKGKARVDVYPVHKKYHDVTNNVRGTFDHVDLFLNKHFKIGQ